MEKLPRSKIPRQDVLLALGVVLAVACVVALTVVTVILNSAASGTLYSSPPFALDSLISDADGDSETVSLANYVVPAFIGVAPAPEGLGISVGDDVIKELYSMLSPCLASGLKGEGAPYTELGWELLRQSDRVVYIKYHSALPVSVLQGAAAAVCGTEESAGAAGGRAVRELFILLPNEQYGDCQVVLRTTDGAFLRFVCDSQEEYPTLADIVDFTQSLRQSFFRFVLGNSKTSSTEPVFLERIRTRNILLTPDTASMMTDNLNHHKNTLLRMFDFNPDKLSTHEEADGTLVTVESHGILRIQSDRFMYTAGVDGGVPLQQLGGYRERYTLFDSLRSACTVIRNLREMYRFYMGGDADVILTGVSRQNEQIRMVFRYAFDNLLLENCDPAMVMVVENGRVMAMDIYAMGVLSYGDIQSGYMESGVLAGLTEKGITDMNLSYRVDLSVLDRGIFPVWTYYKEQ